MNTKLSAWSAWSAWSVGLLVCWSAITLAACGFTPMYGPSEVQRTVAPQLSLIEIGAILNEPGQVLRNHLIDRLYPQGRAGNLAPRYALAASISETKQGLAISSDATVTRQQLVDNVDFTLLDLASHKILLQRHLFVTSGYNVLGSQFSTLIAEQDARGRNLVDLADRMTTALSLYFSNPTQTLAVPPTPPVPNSLFKTDALLPGAINQPVLTTGPGDVP